MRLVFRHGDVVHEVEASSLGAGRYRLVIDGAALELSAGWRGGALELSGSQGLIRAWITRDGRLRQVSAPGLGSAILERLEGRRSAAGADAPPEISSPMPGKVVKVLVAVGDAVEKGQPLLVIEAMKTELQLAAPRAGKVARVSAVTGEMCAAGRALVELQPVG